MIAHSGQLVDGQARPAALRGHSSAEGNVAHGNCRVCLFEFSPLDPEQRLHLLVVLQNVKTHTTDTTRPLVTIAHHRKDSMLRASVGWLGYRPMEARAQIARESLHVLTGP